MEQDPEDLRLKSLFDDLKKEQCLKRGNTQSKGHDFHAPMVPQTLLRSFLLIIESGIVSPRHHQLWPNIPQTNI